MSSRSLDWYRTLPIFKTSLIFRANSLFCFLQLSLFINSLQWNISCRNTLNNLLWWVLHNLLVMWVIYLIFILTKFNLFGQGVLSRLCSFLLEVLKLKTFPNFITCFPFFSRITLLLNLQGSSYTWHHRSQFLMILGSTSWFFYSFRRFRTFVIYIECPGVLWIFTLLTIESVATGITL